MKQKNKKFLNILLILICIILVGIGIFYGTYNFFVNKSYSSYEQLVRKNITEINVINESTSVFAKGQTIDSENILKNISPKVSSLEKIENTINTLIPTDKYSELQSNILSGLANNIKLYKQIYVICNNLKNPNLNELLLDLETYRDKCMNSYALISYGDMKITLPSETLKFVNNTIYFTEKQIRKNKDNEIKQNQNMEFSNSIYAAANSFLNIKKDFTYNVVNVRKGIGTYNDVISEINQNKLNLVDLKNSLKNVAVPQDALNIFEALSTVLDDYDKYLNDFLFAVSTEKLQAAETPLDEASLKNLYKTSHDSFEIISKNYTEFVKLHTKYKNDLLK